MVFFRARLNYCVGRGVLSYESLDSQHYESVVACTNCCSLPFFLSCHVLSHENLDYQHLRSAAACTNCCCYRFSCRLVCIPRSAWKTTCSSASAWDTTLSTRARRQAITSHVCIRVGYCIEKIETSKCRTVHRHVVSEAFSPPCPGISSLCLLCRMSYRFVFFG